MSRLCSRIFQARWRICWFQVIKLQLRVTHASNLHLATLNAAAKEHIFFWSSSWEVEFCPFWQIFISTVSSRLMYSCDHEASPALKQRILEHMIGQANLETSWNMLKLSLKAIVGLLLGSAASHMFNFGPCMTDGGSSCTFSASGTAEASDALRWIVGSLRSCYCHPGPSFLIVKEQRFARRLWHSSQRH